MYAVLPTLYMPLLGLVLYRKFGWLSYKRIHAADPAFGRKLDTSNMLFAVLNGAAIAKIDGYFYS
ncbi:hypothetical protein NCCP691_41400 [Noviherbaspirillum aridicola]|uniref:Uncharacterized protein n=1 Tax=Noviherbaspirillum aridicola TaxID=2849687 RepID=A0ABQ4QAU8_9BURK|nr:hypothetical protein NCCP691_41400 [Noviherbaspirillum aridicola]